MSVEADKLFAAIEYAVIARCHGYSRGELDSTKVHLVRIVSERAELLDALQQFVDEKVDYMRINHLGDPEQTHTVKVARAAIAKATGERQ